MQDLYSGATVSWEIATATAKVDQRKNLNRKNAITATSPELAKKR